MYAYKVLRGTVARADKSMPAHHARLVETTNTKMAAAFVAFGARQPITMRPDSHSEAMFLFERETLHDHWPDSRHAVGIVELANLYSNPAWLEANNNSPLTYVKYGLKWRELLVKAAHEVSPMAYLRQYGRRWLVKPRNIGGEMRIVLPQNV